MQPERTSLLSQITYCSFINMKGEKKMRKTVISCLLTSTLLSGTLGFQTNGTTISGQPMDEGDICYTLTDTKFGWQYVDDFGNPMPTANPPHSSPLPRIPQTPETELPSRFDLRDEGAVTSVKSQVGGTCWAYGAMGAIESNMIKKGMADSSLDLSEAHLIWFGRGLGGSADPNGFLYGDGTSLGTNAYEKGGGTYWVCAPLVAWEGVAYDSDVPSHPEKLPMDESMRFHSVAHLQNMRKIPIDNPREIKETLMEKGALSCSYFIPSGVECVSKHGCFYQTLYDPQNPTDVKGGGHTVTLIGWNDNFPKEYFIETPPGDGAWILKNSWGENASGTKNGFFYISYYEKTFNEVILYDMEPADNYSDIYQYDGDSGCSYLTGKGADSGFVQANVFEARQDENITAIGFYINDYNIPYEAEIYELNPDFSDPRDGRLLTTVSGQTDHIGYYTIPLSTCCGVRKGSLFSVVVKTGACYRTSLHHDNHCYAPRTSFYTIYSESDGELPWTDCYDVERGNVNVKAYTSNGLTLCEAFCPNTLIRENLSKEFDTDGNSFLSEDELAEDHCIPYDIDGNGIVNAVDLTLLKRAVLGIEQGGSEYHWHNGDLNNDNDLTESDIVAMSDYLLSKSKKDT